MAAAVAVAAPPLPAAVASAAVAGGRALYLPIERDNMQATDLAPDMIHDYEKKMLEVMLLDAGQILCRDNNNNPPPAGAPPPVQVPSILQGLNVLSGGASWPAGNLASLYNRIKGTVSPTAAEAWLENPEDVVIQDLDKFELARDIPGSFVNINAALRKYLKSIVRVCIDSYYDNPILKGLFSLDQLRGWLYYLSVPYKVDASPGMSPATAGRTAEFVRDETGFYEIRNFPSGFNHMIYVDDSGNSRITITPPGAGATPIILCHDRGYSLNGISKLLGMERVRGGDPEKTDDHIVVPTINISAADRRNHAKVTSVAITKPLTDYGQYHFMPSLLLSCDGFFLRVILWNYLKRGVRFGFFLLTGKSGAVLYCFNPDLLKPTDPEEEAAELEGQVNDVNTALGIGAPAYAAIQATANGALNGWRDQILAGNFDTHPEGYLLLHEIELLRAKITAFLVLAQSKAPGGANPYTAANWTDGLLRQLRSTTVANYVESLYNGFPAIARAYTTLATKILPDMNRSTPNATIQKIENFLKDRPFTSEEKGRYTALWLLYARKQVPRSEDVRFSVEPAAGATAANVYKFAKQFLRQSGITEALDTPKRPSFKSFLVADAPAAGAETLPRSARYTIDAELDTFNACFPEASFIRANRANTNRVRKAIDRRNLVNGLITLSGDADVLEVVGVPQMVGGAARRRQTRRRRYYKQRGGAIIDNVETITDPEYIYTVRHRRLVPINDLNRIFAQYNAPGALHHTKKPTCNDAVIGGHIGAISELFSPDEGYIPYENLARLNAAVIELLKDLSLDAEEMEYADEYFGELRNLMRLQSNRIVCFVEILHVIISAPSIIPIFYNLLEPRVISGIFAILHLTYSNVLRIQRTVEEGRRAHEARTAAAAVENSSNDDGVSPLHQNYPVQKRPPPGERPMSIGVASLETVGGELSFHEDGMASGGSSSSAGGSSSSAAGVFTSPAPSRYSSRVARDDAASSAGGGNSSAAAAARAAVVSEIIGASQSAVGALFGISAHDVASAFIRKFGKASSVGNTDIKWVIGALARDGVPIEEGAVRAALGIRMGGGARRRRTRRICRPKNNRRHTQKNDTPIAT
jgi:hypothetical protein